MKASTYFALLKKPGFLFFLITQFLGAMNDNVYRLIVSLILVGNSLQGGGVSLTAVVFLVPSGAAESRLLRVFLRPRR